MLLHGSGYHRKRTAGGKRTSLSWRCCKNIFRTSTSGFIGGSARISFDTNSAASGPLATSMLISKLKPLSASVNLMIGTLALPIICGDVGSLSTTLASA